MNTLLQVQSCSLQIKLLRKTEVWIKRLTTICCRREHIAMFDVRSPPTDKLTRKGSYWRIIHYLIGDESEDIVEKATEAQERKVMFSTT